MQAPSRSRSGEGRESFRALGAALRLKTRAMPWARPISCARQASPTCLHFDPRAGHERKSLEEMVAVAEALGAAACLSDRSESRGLRRRDRGARQDGRGDGIAVQDGDAVAAPDLKRTQPTGRAAMPAACRCLKLARQHFPGARLGGGMFSFFTELNRKRRRTNSSTS